MRTQQTAVPWYAAGWAAEKSVEASGWNELCVVSSGGEVAAGWGGCGRSSPFRRGIVPMWRGALGLRFTWHLPVSTVSWKRSSQAEGKRVAFGQTGVVANIDKINICNQQPEDSIKWTNAFKKCFKVVIVWTSDRKLRFIVEQVQAYVTPSLWWGHVNASLSLVDTKCWFNEPVKSTRSSWSCRSGDWRGEPAESAKRKTVRLICFDQKVSLMKFNQTTAVGFLTLYNCYQCLQKVIFALKVSCDAFKAKSSSPAVSEG